MRSKGAIRFVVICLVIASLWQLSFTFVANHYEGKADAYAEEKVRIAKNDTSEFNKVSVEKREAYLDSIRTSASRWYLDSISNEEIYLGYTYKEVASKGISLGLDLKGGMSIVLQIQLEDLVKAMADNSQDERFVAAITKTKTEMKGSKENFIDKFAESWNEVSNGAPLAEVFASNALKGKIDQNSSNDRITEELKSQASSAIDRSFNVLRNRIDRFGVTQPNIQELGNGRILVELPGVKEPDRVRDLLQGTASLEFWPTYQSHELKRYFDEADRRLSEMNVVNKEESTLGAQRPLLSKLQVYYSGGLIGKAKYTDTAEINKYLALPQIKNIFPKDFKALWSAKGSKDNANYFELIAIQTNASGKAPLEGDAVADAEVNISQTGEVEVGLTMTNEGKDVWGRLTETYLGRQIAIVLDGLVYSAPLVQVPIKDGRSSITGDFTIEEAQDLANVLGAGKLPAPASIIQEQVVGPSLGEDSIKSGMISFILAFVLVLIYMVVFYNRAGLIANIALLTNVLLLFGTLVSFGAVLTLPGIAGLVLTLGMAVDANVIIYERVKEELRAGKGLSKAIADGYSNAYSAIIDGQLTTLLTGIVLFFFGSGPVQGFATTLIIGIITSVVTSIFITRIAFDDRLQKGKGIKFDNKFTRNFLQNTKFNFIGKRKIAYIVSSILIIVSVTSIFTKGFTFGVDFTGGRSYVINFDNSVDIEKVRSSVTETFKEAAANDPKVGNPSVQVKQFGADNQIKVTTTYKIEDDSATVDKEVDSLLFNSLKDFYTRDMTREDFKTADNGSHGIVSSELVGKSISDDIRNDAFYAVGIALLVIFAYIAIRFRGWTWGLGGLLGLAHTAIIVIGFFSIFSGILPFSLDIDQTFIAAILTIIGYAINDTVVIFDRIREYKKMHPHATLMQNTNEALNSTLSRTMNTSLTTLVTMLAIAIFGGEVIRGLAVALILGIIIGTYASIFIATPIMYDITSRLEKRAAKKAAKKGIKKAE